MQFDLMLPTPRKFPFSDSEWIFEPKWDGYRALSLIEHGSVRFMSRNKKELTERFPEHATVHHSIKAEAAILDGEIVGLGSRQQIQTVNAQGIVHKDDLPDGLLSAVSNILSK